MNVKGSGEIQIDLYADVICPWCYIGERRLGDRVWLRGEIPDQGEFENEGYFRVHEQERRMV